MINWNNEAWSGWKSCWQWKGLCMNYGWGKFSLEEAYEHDHVDWDLKHMKDKFQP